MLRSVVATATAHDPQAAAAQGPPGLLTDVVQVEAVWVVARHALEKGVAILCGTKACLDGLACILP